MNTVDIMPEGEKETKSKTKLSQNIIFPTMLLKAMKYKIAKIREKVEGKQIYTTKTYMLFQI